MNRIVLIGNGFDLAHDLKTSYQDFINWYWDQRVMGFRSNTSKISEDILCKFTCLNDEVWSVFAFLRVSVVSRPPGNKVIQFIREHKSDYEVKDSPLFENIVRSINTKKWVDIEEEYYRLLTQYAFDSPNETNLNNLNQQLLYLKDKLVEYLTTINQIEVEKNSLIYKKIYAPINIRDTSIESQGIIKEYVNSCVEQDEQFVKIKMATHGYKESSYIQDIQQFKEKFKAQSNYLYTDIPWPYMIPDTVLLLNFNYTHTAELYHNDELSLINNIHGSIEKPKSVIFGYGDELDEKYKKIKETDNNECRRNIKSINYLESDNYKYVLSFMESAPYQIYIMGHSCGKSDRTLLNTLFEHKNCISIKPYFFKKEDGTDNYLELAQNISRNFTDMKLMRDRVVNKMYCESIV